MLLRNMDGEGADVPMASEEGRHVAPQNASRKLSVVYLNRSKFTPP
jgi:hypothetical protein